MATRQVFPTQFSSGGSAIHYYAAPVACVGFNAAVAGQVWSTAGRFKNMRIQFDANASANPRTYVFETSTDGATWTATPLRFTIAPGQLFGSDAVHSVTVTPGMRIRVHNDQFAAGASVSSVTHFSIEFDSDDEAVSGYSGFDVTVVDDTNTYYGNVLNAVGFGTQTPVTLPFTNEALITLTGMFTRYDVAVNVAPGGGGSREAVLVLNGTDQDGTGGTPDTRSTLTGSNTGMSAEFALGVIPGDLVWVKISSTGSPAEATSMSLSSRFQGLVDGESMLVFNNATAAPVGPATRWIRWPGNRSWELSDEDAESGTGALTTFYLSRMRCIHNVQTARTSMLRVNNETILSATALVDTHEEDNEHVAVIRPDDEWVFRTVNPGGAAISRMLMGFVMFVEPLDLPEVVEDAQVRWSAVQYVAPRTTL